MTNPSSCPTPRGYLLTPDGRKPRACGRLACPYCGPRKALSTVRASEMARPHGSAVTTMKDPPTQDRPRLRGFAKILNATVADLREEGICWEHVWVLELSPSG